MTKVTVERVLQISLIAIAAVTVVSMFAFSGLSLTGFSLLGKKVATDGSKNSMFSIASLSLLLVSFVALFFLAWKSKEW
jgi:FtsH-binding integral membrane protein|tara:strand:- start:1581 stop:1817 length:237 start_codon:yes stop_codon:yes gene_type:complete